jgi:cytosine/creatinine deaminase
MSFSTADEKFLKIAVQEAQDGFSEGGIPIGAALVSNSTGKVIAVGRNLRMQKFTNPPQG